MDHESEINIYTINISDTIKPIAMGVLNANGIT